MTRMHTFIAGLTLGASLGWGVPAGLAWEQRVTAQLKRIDGLVGDLAKRGLPISSAAEPDLTPVDAAPGVTRRDTMGRPAR